MRLIFIALFLVFTKLHVQGQVQLNTALYAQDFNGLLNTGAGSTLPIGWVFVETGTNANSNYTAGNGTSTSGDTYSFGTDTNTDRAFGGLQSGSLVPLLGASFSNVSGSIITSLKISYTGEQWRIGALGRVDSLQFQFSSDATSLQNGNWSTIDQLGFSGPQTTGVIGPLDGNLLANRKTVSFTITGLAIAVGQTFYIRWVDYNATGSDDGLAVDDFIIETQTSAGDVTPPVLVGVSPANTSTNVATDPMLIVEFNEAIQRGTAAIQVKRFSDNSTAFSIDPAGNFVSTSGNKAFIQLNGLALSTQYYIELPEGSFVDLAQNRFVGFTGNTTWSFTTTAIPIYSYDFNDVARNTWQSVSVRGDSSWSLLPFGFGTGFGWQINGFTTGVGALDNEDWLVSPKMDLSLYQFPVLRFRHRTRFTGPPIQLFVATGVQAAPSPGSTDWKPLDAYLSPENADKWWLVNDVNLTPFKSATVFIAVKYVSSPALGASRVTIDDVMIENRSNAPASKIIFTTPSIVQFEAVPGSAPTPSKAIKVRVYNPTSYLYVTVTAPFELSKNNQDYSRSAEFGSSEIIGQEKTLYLRYVPTVNAAASVGTITVISGSDTTRGSITGNTYERTKTLDVVNWNLLWFGSAAAGQGPVNDDAAQANVKRIMDSLDADIYAVQEVVDINRFRNLVESLNGFGFVISDYASNASDANSSAYAVSQKLALVYRRSVVSNVTARGLLRTSTSASANWASGRFPFLVEADVNLSSGSTRIAFIVVHGKAGNTSSDHQRRKDAANELKDTLNAAFAARPYMLLGDYNDDLDSTISEGITPAISSYAIWVADSTDGDHVKALSLPQSLNGMNSVIGFSDVVDHALVSNELFPDYIPGSSRLVTDVQQWINNYATTTSDHFPLMSRFLLSSSTNPTALVNYDPQEINLRLLGNPVSNQLIAQFTPKAGKYSCSVYSIGGDVLYRSGVLLTSSVERRIQYSVSSWSNGTYFLSVQNNGKNYILPFIVHH
ncbi:MAG: Ig-like domain-containing protein [Bacteroidota bacterium]